MINKKEGASCITTHLRLILQFFFCCIWRNYTLKAIIRKLLLQVLEVCVQVLIVLNGASFGLVFENTILLCLCQNLLATCCLSLFRFKLC